MLFFGNIVFVSLITGQPLRARDAMFGTDRACGAVLPNPVLTKCALLPGFCAAALSSTITSIVEGNTEGLMSPVSTAESNAREPGLFFFSFLATWQ